MNWPAILFLGSFVCLFTNFVFYWLFTRIWSNDCVVCVSHEFVMWFLIYTFYRLSYHFCSLSILWRDSDLFSLSLHFRWSTFSLNFVQTFCCSLLRVNSLQLSVIVHWCVSVCVNRFFFNFATTFLSMYRFLHFDSYSLSLLYFLFVFINLLSLSILPLSCSSFLKFL